MSWLYDPENETEICPIDELRRSFCFNIIESDPINFEAFKSKAEYLLKLVEKQVEYSEEAVKEADELFDDIAHGLKDRKHTKIFIHRMKRRRDLNRMVIEASELYRTRMTLYIAKAKMILFSL